MPKVLQLDSRDNVLIALTDLRQGETVGHNAGTFTLFSSVPAKHKFATEDLLAYAQAMDFPEVGGSYVVEGRGKDAKPYSGTLDLRQHGKGFDVAWHFGADGYGGKGTLNGNVLVVDWGQTSPAVYALQADGSFVGLWDSGAGEETLTPEH